MFPAIGMMLKQVNIELLEAERWE